MSDFGELMKDLREHRQAVNSKRRDENTAWIKALAEKYDTIALHWFTPYHVRVSGKEGSLDYYPTSGKIVLRGYIDRNTDWVKECFKRH